MTFFDLAQDLEREYAGQGFGENVKRRADIVRKCQRSEGGVPPSPVRR